ncbi:hypothetical protein ACO0K0_08650 [Undibacterium sp. SXout11W]|uniref:hypothetical protein n=1 Tax=Undibacterium sp. SXout11W TaxID=3413050 RepID=UPI003BF1177A
MLKPLSKTELHFLAAGLFFVASSIFIVVGSLPGLSIPSGLLALTNLILGLRNKKQEAEQTQSL